MKHVFISYSHQDSEFMQRIVADLNAKGINTWTDIDLVPGTRAWKIAIQNAIEQAGALIALMTPDAKASEWVDRELEYARIQKVRVFPVLVRGTEAESVPLELVSSQWIQMTTQNTYFAGLAHLVRALDGHLGTHPKSRTERMIEQLSFLREKLPNAYFIGTVSIDGLVLYVESDIELDEDKLGLMAAIFSEPLGHAISEPNRREYAFTCLKEKTGWQLFILTSFVDDVLIVVGIRESGSIDATLTILSQGWHPLLELF